MHYRIIPVPTISFSAVDLDTLGLCFSWTLRSFEFIELLSHYRDLFYVCVYGAFPWFWGDFQHVCPHMELKDEGQGNPFHCPCMHICVSGTQTISQVRPSDIGTTTGVAVLFECVSADWKLQSTTCHVKLCRLMCI
jgi:hypothetical protein